MPVGCRAGYPNLHTHVAIANKAQGLDGKWRSVGGRLIYQSRVAVSETYNTQLEAHLREALGLEFVERGPTLERRAVSVPSPQSRPSPSRSPQRGCRWGRPLRSAQPPAAPDALPHVVVR